MDPAIHRQGCPVNVGSDGRLCVTLASLWAARGRDASSALSGGCEATQHTMYQTSIEASMRRLSELMRERRKLDAEIARLQTLVRIQAVPAEDDPEKSTDCDSTVEEDEPIGFTEAIRQVLFTYPLWLTPVLVRDLLPSVGFDPDSSKNVLVSIHTVLKRLVRSGVAVRRQSDKDVLYRRMESNPDVAVAAVTGW